MNKTIYKNTLNIIVIIIFIFFSLMLKPFSSFNNIMEFLRQASVNAIIVLGVTQVIASGEFDVSFPEIAAFSSMMTSYLMTKGIGFGVAALITLCAAAVFGLCNGILVTRFRFSSLIASIAISGVAKSLAALIGRGSTIHVSTAANSVLFNIVRISIFGVPLILIITIALFLIFKYLQDSTVFGQYIYAIGENRQASKIAGISERFVLMRVFVVSTVFSSLGGILVMTMLQSGQPKLGASLFLDGFTMVFLGAIAFKISKANVMGTLVGAILLSVLMNGLTMLGSPSFINEIIKGILLMSSVIIVNYLTNKSRRSLLQI